MPYKSIVLSGLPGSGKSVLLKSLSELYGWPVHSIGDLWRAQWKKTYPYEQIPFEEFWRNTTLEENRLMNINAREIYSREHVIGDTRYSPYCKDLPVLLAFITAPLGIRAERALKTGKYASKSFEEIRQILLDREGDEIRVGKELYGSDYDYRDPNHYNIMLNSCALSIEEEVLTLTHLLFHRI